jgi:hypothetical protein
MNPTPAPAILPRFSADMRALTALCEEAIALAGREHRALAGSGDYQAFEFHRLRKDLLARLDPLMIEIRRWRQIWQQFNAAERAVFSDVKTVMQKVQDLLVKFLQLDRENQQALLRRGLVPARHVESCAVPPSNYVANLYRRNSSH